MEIDSHILGLSMEFEKQNIIITEWETERAKTRSDQVYIKRKKRRSRRKQPKIYLEPTDSEPNDEYDEEEADYERNDDNESGFEVNHNWHMNFKITKFLIHKNWGKYVENFHGS